MRRIASYGLLILSFVVVGVLLYRDPVIQGLFGPQNNPEAFMRGMCERDEKKMRAASGPPFSEWTDEHWHAAIGALIPCSGVRYLGSLNSQRGPEYVYVLTVEDGTEEFFVLGTSGGKVVSVK